MRRGQLEHILRAASRIVGQPDFLVVGSAAILGSFDETVLPLAATRSDEADLAPFDEITPCGIAGVKMTSLERARGWPISVEEVARHVARSFSI